MKSNGNIVRVGVQTIVRRNELILIGRRKNTFQEGSWGLPGGHLETNETILQAAARELLEETGLRATKMEVFCVTDPTIESNFHMQVGVVVLAFEGEPAIMEPHKCSELKFCDKNNLPSPIFVSSTQVIKNYFDNEFYVEHE